MPPNTLSVDSPDAIVCPSSLTIVLNVSPLPAPPVWSTNVKLPTPSVLKLRSALPSVIPKSNIVAGNSWVVLWN